ncbi:hypothetical protein [Desulfosarcina sp.]|uniref:hypothetical protein n=1 Tax=Desulfosarcina sp. TaxID=2027861 RepID=UPI0039704DD1
MTLKNKFLVIAALILAALPAFANQAAVIPAYALVSAFQSSMQEYQTLMRSQNRVAARQLLNSEKIFLAPRDVRVEIVTVDACIAKVRLRRLNENAEPVTLYFWTLTEQLKMLPQE